MNAKSHRAGRRGSEWFLRKRLQSRDRHEQSMERPISLQVIRGRCLMFVPKVSMVQREAREFRMAIPLLLLGGVDVRKRSRRRENEESTSCDQPAKATPAFRPHVVTILIGVGSCQLLSPAPPESL